MKQRTKDARGTKRKREVEELQLLEKRVAAFDGDGGGAKKFADLPLSQQTLAGLEKSFFTNLTDIQARALPVALKGRDVLGAARTGSGKTLAFLLPVLEALFRRKWTHMDGLGALIISPTRELAVQIFEVLRKIGCRHTFSAGLVIGGKDLAEERDCLSRMNILICTPGRILQHMDQTAGFETNNLQVLVLDEADRILDLGFAKAVDAIVENLPKDRQTLLFSATQTKKVSDLARLSLHEPEYVAVHEGAAAATPASLSQHYIVVPLAEKLDTLYGFIKTHLKTKSLVFFSSCKQVRFAYESFRMLQPGVSLLHLHGKQKQSLRASITQKFTTATHAFLFSTDVVARGLDFPAVDWVVQVDAPEDADTYIHRVGRTARYEKEGKALLMLTPSEEGGMVDALKGKKVPMEQIQVKEKRKGDLQSKLQAMCFKDPEIKYLGQKAFISYVRSIYLQRDKSIFDPAQIAVMEFAASLGLPGPPKIRLGKIEKAKEMKNAPTQGFDEPKSVEEGKAVRTKFDRMFERKNQNVLSQHYAKLIDTGPSLPDAGLDDDVFTLKRRDHDVDDDVEDRVGEMSKRKQRQLLSKKQISKMASKGTRLLFDEQGEAHPLYEMENESDFERRGAARDQIESYVLDQKRAMSTADTTDKQAVKEKRRELKQRRQQRDLESSVQTGEDQEQGSRVIHVEEPETLGDLERLGAQLLG